MSIFKRSDGLKNRYIELVNSSCKHKKGEMMNMRLTIRKKLFISFGIVILIIVSLGLYSLRSLSTVNEKSVDISKKWMPRTIIVNDLNTLTSDYRLREYAHMVTENNTQMGKLEDEMKTLNKTIEDNFSKYEKGISAEDERQIFNKVRSEWNTYLQMSQKAIALSRNMQTAQAIYYLDNDTKPIFDSASKILLTLVEYNLKHGEQASTEADVVYGSTIWVATIIMVVSIILSLTIAFLISKNICAAVNELVRVSDRLAAGDLTESVKLDSQDELGDLARSNNKTIGALRKLIDHIQGTADKVADAANSLNSSADQSAQVVNQVAQSISEVAASSSSQVDAIANTSAVVEEMSASAEEVAAIATMSAEQAGNAANMARDGRESIQKAVNQMQTIEATVNNSAIVVQELGEMSKAIGQIVDTIDGIASQTNLLALNAAIEAARAGEHGRGFAVVAEEVRKLAEQSQEATKQISDLIKNIQDKTEKAVAAMHSGTEEVKVGTEVVDYSGKAFVDILNAVTHVSSEVSEIATTIQEMAKGTQQIVVSVQDIDKSCKDVANESSSVSAATEEQSAAMQEMAAASQSMERLAQDLRSAAMTFKL